MRRAPDQVSVTTELEGLTGQLKQQRDSIEAFVRKMKTRSTHCLFASRK